MGTTSTAKRRRSEAILKTKRVKRKSKGGEQKTSGSPARKS